MRALDAAPHNTPIESAQAGPHTVTTVESSATYQVLIVDDRLAMRSICGGIVANMGHEAVLASNGLEALARVKEQVPDLILTDVQLSRLDGLELVDKLKEQGIMVPVILHTSLHDMLDRPFALPIVRCIYKDEDHDALKGTLHDCIALLEKSESGAMRHCGEKKDGVKP